MATKTIVKSGNGEMEYSDGWPEAECNVCHEEHTDIRWKMTGMPGAEAICIYCANQRKDAWKPTSYLGAS